MRGRSRRTLALAGAMVAVALLSAPVLAGNPNGRPSRGAGKLAIPEGGPDDDARARIDCKHFPENRSRDERSWLRLKIRHLDASTEYTLWADDPATPETDLVQFDVFTTNEDGKENYRQDTKHMGALPFGATLADLGDNAIEIRDAAGTTTILAGVIPATLP